MTRSVRGYLKVLAAFTMLSGLAQLFLPRNVAAASAWGFAAGWQREIAFWDFAMYLVIAGTLRSNEPSSARTVTIALVLLQVVVTTNHAVAAVETLAPLNLSMAILNGACVVFGALALRTQYATRISA